MTTFEVPTDGPQPWMLELAKMLILKNLPTGVIVGTASIKACTPVASCQLLVAGGEEKDLPSLATSNLQPATLYEWHLTDVERVRKMRKPKGHPQPVWFTPF